MRSIDVSSQRRPYAYSKKIHISPVYFARTGENLKIAVGPLVIANGRLTDPHANRLRPQDSNVFAPAARRIPFLSTILSGHWQLRRNAELSITETAQNDPDERADKADFAGLAKGGSYAEAAIARLYADYGPRFRAFARMRGVSIESTEDLVQQVFMRLMESRLDLAAVESPRAYLWSTMRNALTDHFRRHAREQAIFSEVPGVKTGDEDPEFDTWLERVLVTDGREHETADHLECVARALERFRRADPDRAAAIDLIAIEGFDGREFATAIGKTYGAAREFLSQARKALRALVESMCGGLYV